MLRKGMHRMMKAHEIKAALTLKNVSQADIARKLGVKRMTVNGVIAGRGKSERIQQEVAKVIGKPVEEVWPQSA